MVGPEYAKPCPTMQRSGLVLATMLAAVFSGWPSAARAADDDCIHAVAAGETLGHIANVHGVTQRALIDANSELKKNPDMLRVGQKLDVCAAKSAGESSTASSGGTKKKAKRCGSSGQIVEHEVAKGDTLGRIVHRYDTSERDIFKRNPELAEEPHVLRVGQTVEICVDHRRAKASKVCGFRTPLHQHEVVPGENLGQIAGRYGVRRSDLLKWNSRLRKNPDLLSVGNTVAVCPEIAPRQRDRITYEVQPGDNLGTIAERYDLTARELERFQRGKLDDPSKLRPGDKLVVWVDGGIVDGFGSISDDEGVLAAGVQLPPGQHYHIKWEAGAWGTASSIRAIQTAVSSYKKKMPGGPKVRIGDISKRGGGPFQPHSSHQHGRDVDVGYVLTGDHADEKRFRGATKDNLDVARTWRLIKSFIDTNEVVYVFVDYKLQELLYEHAKGLGASEELLDELFQYPRGRRRTHGIIRHWKGHTNHFHVRFRE